MIFSVIGIIFGVILLTWFFLSGRVMGRLETELSEAARGCTAYDAAVLDVHSVKGSPEEVIVQFRIPEEKRTVINRCSQTFYGKYSRGDKVKLLFREEMPVDFSMLDGDNIYEHRLSTVKAMRLPSAVVGAASIIISVITLLLY